MKRSPGRFVPPDEFAGDGSDEHCEVSLERIRRVRYAIEAGLRHHRDGDLREAADIYYHVLELHPGQSDALHLLGLISYQSGEPDAALRLVDRAIAAEPENAVFHISQGDILQALGRLPGAVESYRRGLALDPDLPEGYNNCGNALHAQRKYQEAAGFYRHAIAIRPDYSAAHNNLGNVLRDQGCIEDSIESFETALNFAPDFATVHNNLGNALRDAGRVEEAIVSHRRALAIEPDFAEAHFNLGNALCDAAILDEATLSYRRAVALRPEFADAHYNLGNALRDADRHEEAVAAYLAALAVKPSHTDAHNNLANVLRELGRYDEARFHYRTVLGLDPGNANATHLLAALEGRTTEIAPRGYVREMFDRYAAVFDTQLVEALDYRAPEHLRAAVARLRPAGFGRALDLGCGTGLVAAAFADLARVWRGVDLSPAMIAEAEAKALYEALYVEDVIDFLHGRAPAHAADTAAGEAERFDLVTAADVFIYIGNLAPVFAAVRDRLEPGGVFAFTVELAGEADAGANPGYVLCPTGRFAHGEGYVQALARAHGFTVAALEPATLRTEHERPVAGLVLALEPEA